MADLLDKLKELEAVSAKLEPSEEERHSLVASINGFSDWFINGIDDRKSFHLKRADAAKLSIDGVPKSMDQILQLYKDEVTFPGINPASGGHIGYIPGGGIFASALGDYIADVSNEYAGMYFGGPGAVAIENELINWMKGVFGYPETAIGNLTSGGSIANLIALTAARDKHKIKGAKIENSVIYLSPQVHHCIHKAIRIIGLEDIEVNYLELNERSQIKTDHLRQQIAADRAAGKNPFLVIASAGTTDTGAIDPLREIGEIAKSNEMWYHIDGAYGGFFILTERAKNLFDGIALSDSLVIDPHKGMFLPYGLGTVLVKDQEAVFHSNHYTANYMQDANDPDLPLNPADVSPELTKHFRGLRMWLPLQLHGIEPFVACLEEKLFLTDYFRQELINEGFNVGPEPDLSVSYFWYEPEGADQNAFNKKLMQNIHADGEIFLSSTRINEMEVIRMAILSFRTKRFTIDKCMDMIRRCLKQTMDEFGI